MNRILLLVFWILTNFSLSAQVDASELETSIAAAVRYLNSLPHSQFTSYNQRLLFVFVHENYQLPAQPRSGILRFKIKHEEDKAVRDYYLRIINSKHKFSKSSLSHAYLKSEGILRAMLWGIYPDYLPLDSCKSVFETTTDIRGIAHLALAMRWAEKNKTNEQHRWLSQWYDKYEKQLLALSPQAGITTDSGMEGVLGLVCLGRKDKIPLSWINSIIQAQCKDGGWNYDGKNDGSSNPHTTLIALWVLAAMQPAF